MHWRVLQRKRVLKISFKALRPEVLFSRHLDQLGRDPYAFAGTQHGSFHHGFHVQLARDLGQGLANVLYIITEVREITRSALICPRSAINASVIPSAK
jgi:hypothetical protein